MQLFFISLLDGSVVTGKEKDRLIIFTEIEKLIRFAEGWKNLKGPEECKVLRGGYEDSSTTKDKLVEVYGLDTEVILNPDLKSDNLGDHAKKITDL